jgi:hypothetical protein
VEGYETARNLWLLLSGWALILALVTPGRATSSRLDGPLWRGVHLEVLVLLLLPWGGIVPSSLQERLALHPIPWPPGPTSPRALALLAVFGVPLLAAGAYRCIRADGLEKRPQAALVRLVASTLRAYGWFGLAPALVSAAPWLVGLPPEAGGGGLYVAWAVWCTISLLLGALVGTAARRGLSGKEAFSRAIAQCLLLGCWLLPTWPAAALCEGMASERARAWLVASLALGALLAGAAYRVLRTRLGMPEEEILGVRRCLARGWRWLATRRRGAPRTRASSPPPDRPAETGSAPTAE